MDTFSDTTAELSAAAVRSDCNWEYVLEDRDPLGILLPDAQFLRTYARLLAVKTRFEVRSGELHEALHSMRDGMALGQHAAQGAISGQRPDRHHGLFSHAPRGRRADRPSSRAESLLGTGHAAAPAGSPGARAQRRASVSRVEIPRVGRSRPPAIARPVAGTGQRSCEIGPKRWPKASSTRRPRRRGDKGARSRPPRRSWKLRGVPCAILRLPAAKVAAMPAAEVEVRYTVALYREISDSTQKWFYVAYRQSLPASSSAVTACVNKRDAGSCTRWFRCCAPLAAISSSPRRGSIARWHGCKRSKQCAMHAAATGKLPETLAAVSFVPVPADPVTGQPFLYRLEGEVAVVDAAAAADGTPKSLAEIGLPVRIRVTRKVSDHGEF